MNKAGKALCVALILGLVFSVAGCSRKEEPHEAADLEYGHMSYCAGVVLFVDLGWGFAPI